MCHPHLVLCSEQNCKTLLLLLQTQERFCCFSGKKRLLCDTHRSRPGPPPAFVLLFLLCSRGRAASRNRLPRLVVVAISETPFKPDHALSPDEFSREFPRRPFRQRAKRAAAAAMKKSVRSRSISFFRGLFTLSWLLLEKDGRWTSQQQQQQLGKDAFRKRPRGAQLQRPRGIRI